jgi:hypothetical protein
MAPGWCICYSGSVKFQYVPADICIVISDKSPEAVLTYMHLHDVEWGAIDNEPLRIDSPWFRTPFPLELTQIVNIWCEMKNTNSHRLLLTNTLSQCSSLASPANSLSMLTQHFALARLTFVTRIEDVGCLLLTT